MFKNIIQNKVDILKALAHPTRLKILEMLCDGERCVCEINVLVEIEQSNVSQHLAILKKAGILTSRKEGSKVIYKVKYDGIFQILNMLDDLISEQIEEQMAALEGLRQKTGTFQKNKMII
jgi:ArsR family transcriptional regulator